MKYVLLTFDLEEFDLPREFNIQIAHEDSYELSYIGLLNLIELLNKHNLKATFFTTAKFAQKYPKIIKQLSEKHEIASHGISHSTPLTLENLKQAKQIKEKIINKPVKGFRAPRWNLKNVSVIEQAGFSYDSSSHPIYLPGRYFNVNKKKYVHKIEGIIEVPLSTLPLNFSLFWLAFKNFPLIYAKMFTRLNFMMSDYTMLLLHPWEFTKIKHFKLPWYINKINNLKLLKKLEDYILFCKSQNYNFKKVEDYLNNLYKP